MTERLLSGRSVLHDGYCASRHSSPYCQITKNYGCSSKKLVVTKVKLAQNRRVLRCRSRVETKLETKQVTGEHRVCDRSTDGADLCTLKQLDTVLETWAFMEASESIYIYIFGRLHEIGADTCEFPSRGIWCCRRLVAHHSTSVFAVFSCRRLLRIHSATSSTHVDIFSLRAAVADGSHVP